MSSTPSKPDQGIDQENRANTLVRYSTLAAGLEKATIAKYWQGSQPHEDWVGPRLTRTFITPGLRCWRSFVQSLLPKEDNQ